MIVYYQSPIGVLEIIEEEDLITDITFVEDVQIIEEQYPENVQECIKQLDEYFNYKRESFDFNYSLKGTDFQLIVWDKLLSIPFGSTLSYMDIALMVGGKDIIRAVGSAIGKNRLNIVVPCHRVIGTNGELTGYAGGLKRKEWLLNFENRVKQGNLFYNTTYKLM